MQYFFSKLSNNELISRLKTLHGEEKKILAQVLESIAEFDKRKLFLELGYPSLFEFLVQEVGYSPSSAQRRIDGARLLNQIPEVASKIETGSLNLSQISKLQKAVREKNKSGIRVSVNEKRDLVFKLENLAPRETEVLINQSLEIKPTIQENIKHQRDESVRLELTLTPDQMEKLKEAKDLLSHSLPQASFAELITYLAEKLIKAKKGGPALATAKPAKVKTSDLGLVAGSEAAAEDKTTTTTAVTALQVHQKQKQADAAVIPQALHEDTELILAKLGLLKPQNQPIASAVKQKILARDRHCQYRDPKTQKACSSRYFLEIDHIKAREFGGDNNPDNLRLLCSNHHRQRHGH